MGDLPRALSFATITKPHGVRGELRVRLDPELIPFLEDLAEAGVPITLRPKDAPERPVVVASLRGAGQTLILELEGVDDRTGAEALRGALLAADRELLPPTGEGEFYLADVAGCEVFDHATGARVGEAVDAKALPAGVVVTIRLDGDSSELLAPTQGDAMPLLDVDARRIEVDCGFLDIGGAS